MNFQVNKRKVFQNPDPFIHPKNFFDVLKWRFSSKKISWPKEVAIEMFDRPPQKVEGEKVRISFVGHVTFLIQAQGVNILTDPVWSDRASPFSFAGPKRATPPGINFEDLPKIDIVLVSHNHYDHMDITTLKKLWLRDQPEIIAPLMNDIILASAIPHIKVTTLDWEEKIQIKENINIYLEPAQHWSARSLFDRNKALWGTFIIKLSDFGSICFIGDTGYSPKIFRTIGEKHNDIRISLIPIGAYEPRWFMKDVHINPEEAILIHQDLKSKYSIASHFRTFPLADDSFFQPESDLKLAKEKYKISDEEFIIPKIGGVYWF